MREYLAIDIGGTYIKFGVVNNQGNLSGCSQVRTPKDKEGVLQQLSEIIQAHPSINQGIGISVPGKVDVATKTIFHGGALPFLHGLALGKWVEENFNMPVSLQNDGKAAALGEAWGGELKGVKDGAVLVLGTGIGGGIILDGKVREGAHHQAGEVSFMLSTPDPTAITSFVGSAGSSVWMIHDIGKLLELENPNDGKEVFKHIQNKQPLALARFENYCEIIAVLIHNCQSLLDLEKFVIGGGISQQDCLIPMIEKKIEEIYQVGPDFLSGFPKPEITRSHLQSQANLVGAVAPLESSHN